MPGNPLSDPNFAAQLTDKIDHYVGLVRDNATVRVVKVVRAAVFGVLAAIAALVAAVVGTVLMARIFQGLVRFAARSDHATSVWISYLAISALLFGLGAVLMRSRHSSSEQ